MAEWPLTGRDEELRLLVATLLEDARGAVVVSRPGVGKSRVVREAVARAEAAGAATEVVVATRSAMSVPLGAVAALLPDEAPAVAERLDLFRAVRAELGGRAAGRPLVLAVDDAHLLDPGSAALVHHLALTGTARPLVAVRDGEPVEDAITALWRDGLADRIELQPLSTDDVAELLEAGLGGDVELRTARRLWTVSGGNPLYVRELAAEATRSGALRDQDGVWCWRGEIGVGSRLRELVALRLTGLEAAARAVVDLLAVGEPLAQAVVEALCDPAAVVALEQRGMVVARRSARGTLLTLDHPLFAEIVRRALPTGERARLCRVLADAVDPDVDRDLSVLLRVATWQVEGGGEVDAALLARAARRANQLFDAGLAERLARAALAAGGDVDATLVLGEALYRLGRFDEALVAVAPLHGADLDDEHLAQLAMLVADAGYWGLGRAADTDADLARIEARLTDSGAQQRLHALRAAVTLASGRLEEAGRQALPLAADSGADPLARLRASTAAAMWLSFRGDAGDALALCDELVPLGVANVDRLRLGVSWVLAQRILALMCLARFDEAEQVLAPLRAVAVAEGDDEIIGGSSLVLGRIAMSRGDLPRATAMLREAAASLRQYDPTGYLPWCLAVTAQVAAQAGDGQAALAAMTEVTDRGSPVMGVYAFELHAGRGWTAAAGGELTAAGEQFLAGADAALEHGNRFAASLLLHDGLRCGLPPSDVVTRLRAIGDEMAGNPLHAVFLAHATALAAASGGDLDAVGERFEAIGAVLMAAEAAAEAAVAHRRAGLRANASRAAGRATRLAEACGKPRTPALAGRAEAPDLTRREREVSTLAAAGATNAEIAARLSVNVRTVEGHLLRAMTKLGVRDRRGLGAALGD